MIRCQGRGSNPSRTAEGRTAPQKAAENREPQPARATSEGADEQPTAAVVQAGPSARSILDELAALVGRAVAEGNLDLARALIDAQRSAQAPAAPVVDLATERARRTP